ncbi:hypothetical protein Tco_0921502 [Tanacetum coccineum]
MRRGEGGVLEPAELHSTKIVLKRKPASKEKPVSKEKRVKEKSKKVKEIEQRMIDEEIDDDLDDTLEEMKTQKLKGVSETKIETHEHRDSLDSNQTPSATRLDVVDKGDEDDVSNYIVLIHEKTSVAKEKGTPILTTIISIRTRSNVRLNYHARSSGKEKLSGDFVDQDRVPESQMVVVPEVTMTEPTGPDQSGSTRVDSVLITPDETLTLEETPRGNPELTSCTSEPISTKVIQEVHNHAPTLVLDVVADIVRPCFHKVVSHVLCTEHITLTTSLASSSTNIIIPQLKETLYEMMSNNPKSTQGDINNDLYIALSQSIAQYKQAAPTDSCRPVNLKKKTHDDQDDRENHEEEKRHKKQKFVGQSSSRNDQVVSETSDHDMQSSSTRKTYPDELQEGEIVPDNSTLTFSIRIKRCLNVDKLNLSKLEEFRKDVYELFGNRFMTRDYGLGLGSKEPLPLVGPKLNRRIPLENFFNKDIEYLKTGNKELKGRKNEKKRFLKGDEVSKLCDGTLTDIKDQLENMLRLNRAGQRHECLYNKEWSTRDVKRYTSMLKKIETVLRKEDMCEEWR